MNDEPPEPITEDPPAAASDAAIAVVRALLERLVRRIRSERVSWCRSAFGVVVVILLLCARATNTNPQIVWMLVLGLWIAEWIASKRLNRWEPKPAVIARHLEAFDPSLQGRLLTALNQPAEPNPPLLHARLWNEVAERAEAGSWEQCIPRWRLYAAGTVQILVQAAVVFACIQWLLLPERIRPESVAQTTQSPLLSPPEVVPGNIEIEKGSHFSASARLEQTSPGVYLYTRQAGAEPVKFVMLQALAEPLYGASIESVEHDLEYWVETPSGRSSVFKIRTFEHPKLDRSNATVLYPEGTQPRERIFENSRKLTVPEAAAIDWEFQLNKPVKTAALRHKDGRIEVLAARRETTTLHWKIAPAASSIEAKLELEDFDGRKSKEAVAFYVQVLPNQPPKIRPILPRADARFTSIEEVDFEAEVWDESGLKRWGVTIALGTKPPLEFVMGRDARASQKQRLHHLESLEQRSLKAGDSVTWFYWAEDATATGGTRRVESDLFLGRIRPFEEIYRQEDGDDGEGEKGDPQLLELQRQVLAATWNLRRDTATTEQRPADYQKGIETVRDSEKKVQQMAQEAEGKESKEIRLIYYADARQHLSKAVSELGTAAASKTPVSLETALAAERSAYDALAHLSPSNYNIKRSKTKASSNKERTAQMTDLDFSKEEDRYEKKTAAKTAEQEKERSDTEDLLARLRALARKQQEVSERIKELQARIQGATDENTKAEAKRELKRLSDEQKSLAQELENAQQKTASKNEALSSQQENMDAARNAAHRAANALDRGALDEARAAAAKSSDKVRESSNALRKQLSGQNKEDARELQSMARELAHKEQLVSESMNPTSKKEGAKLEARNSRKQLADDLNSQRQGLRQLQDQIQKVAESTETAEPNFSKALQDIHRSTIQNQTEAKLKVASDALTLAQSAVARRAEEAAAKDLEKLAEDVQKAAEEVFGDDVQSLRQARKTLDDLSRQIASAAPSSAPRGSQQGSSQAQDSASRNQPQATSVSPNNGSTHGGADGVPAQSIANWLSTLDRVEALLERPQLRAAVARAQHAGERLQADMKRAATKPSKKEIADRLLSPLVQIRESISSELARIEGKQSDTPVDRDPVPSRFEEPVRKYYEALGGGK